tara:strand:+ start:563 stop:1036 length:474 start_codon:yes stop_codon:yes gene_type:complete
MIRLVVSTAMLLSGLVGPVAATDTEVITEVTGKIREFVAGMAKGEVQAASVADEQIIAYSSGGMWEYLSGAEFIASMTEGPKLVAKGYHINVRLLGDAKDVAYASYYLGGKITQDGEVIVVDYRTRVSQVLQKDGKNWVIVATHASPLFGGSGVPAD